MDGVDGRKRVMKGEGIKRTLVDENAERGAGWKWNECGRKKGRKNGNFQRTSAPLVPAFSDPHKDKAESPVPRSRLAATIGRSMKNLRRGRDNAQEAAPS